MRCLICLFILLSSTTALAEIDVERLATAIYYAEGGAHTRYPYGIMRKYKTTTPRQACINTINHALRDYKGKDEGFITYLGSTWELPL